MAVAKVEKRPCVGYPEELQLCFTPITAGAMDVEAKIEISEANDAIIPTDLRRINAAELLSENI